MTISTETSTITYLGNGATTVFTFPFVGVTADDIEVIYTASDGSSTTLTSSQYTLVINATPVGELWGVGGSVTYPTGMSPTPIASGTFLTINRIVPYTQDVSISNQGAFYPQAVEQALDLLELQIQQIETLSSYSIRAPITDVNPPNTLPIASERANGYLGFDNNGQPIVFTTAPAVSTLTSATPRVVNASGVNTINVLTTDSFGGISVYQTAGATTTVQLPTGYGPFPVFDGSLNAGTYQITVLPPVGMTIGGYSSWPIFVNGQSEVFYNDGTKIIVG